MILPITLAVLMSQLALADESEPVDSIPTRRGVQIGAAAPVRSTEAFHPPLDNRFSIHFRGGSLQDFFTEVSRQTKLEFIMVPGIGECRIAAFLNDLTAREALQTVLEAGRITYQQLGRSNSYTITGRFREKFPCQLKPKDVAVGQCRAGSSPVSINCKDGKLSEFTEQLSDQSGMSLVVWHEALDFPVNINLSKVSPEKALKKIRKNKALKIKQLGTKNIFTFALKDTASLEQSSVQPSTRIISITPAGAQEYFSPGKRKEPEANPAFKSGMPN